MKTKIESNPQNVEDYTLARLFRIIGTLTESDNEYAEISEIFTNIQGYLNQLPGITFGLSGSHIWICDANGERFMIIKEG